jgi:hypothetical protein
MSSTSGGRSVGIVRFRTKGHGVCFCIFFYARKLGRIPITELLLRQPAVGLRFPAAILGMSHSQSFQPFHTHSVVQGSLLCGNGSCCKTIAFSKMLKILGLGINWSLQKIVCIYSWNISIIPFYLPSEAVHSANCVKLMQRHVEVCSVALLSN